jgi:hypothetical protein
MKLRSMFLMISGLLILANLAPGAASAHQPYCENTDSPTLTSETYIQSQT